MPTIYGQLVDAQTLQSLPDLTVNVIYRRLRDQKEALAQKAISDGAGQFKLTFQTTYIASQGIPDIPGKEPSPAGKVLHRYMEIGQCIMCTTMIYLKKLM